MCVRVCGTRGQAVAGDAPPSLRRPAPGLQREMQVHGRPHPHQKPIKTERNKPPGNPPLASVLMTASAASLYRMAVTGSLCRLGSSSTGSLLALRMGGARGGGRVAELSPPPATGGAQKQGGW